MSKNYKKLKKEVEKFNEECEKIEEVEELKPVSSTNEPEKALVPVLSASEAADIAVSKSKEMIESKEIEEEIEEEEKKRIEKEIRQYVKRSGGFRKDIDERFKSRTEKLLKKLDRNKLEWDESIIPY